MKSSPFQIILLSVFGVGALIGLFVFATYTNNSGGSDTVGTVVVWGTLPSDGVQSALVTIAQTETALKSVSYIQKDALTLPADLASAIATGAAPDLVLASQEELLSLVKFITPISPKTLSSRTFLDTFIRGGDIFSSPSGSGYLGVPFLVDPLILFNNRSILASKGIAKPPVSWEALVGLASNVAEFTPSRQITRGLIALGTYDNVNNARGILSALLLQQNIPISSYSTSGSLAANLDGASSEDETTGSSALGFYTQFADPSKVSYTWNASLPNSRQAFLSGDLALYLGYASEARRLRAANPNLNFDASLLPQPVTATVKSAYGLVYAFMIPRGAKNPAGAYQAAAMLTNDTAQAIASSATGLAPATLNQLAIAPADSISAVAYSEALFVRGWLSPASASTDTVFSAMIRDVISGRSSLETALSSAERSLSALLQQ